jgi:hypothetical protein
MKKPILVLTAIFVSAGALAIGLVNSRTLLQKPTPRWSRICLKG